MSADVTAWVRALAADFESRGDFATASDLLALCTAYAQVTAERDAALEGLASIRKLDLSGETGKGWKADIAMQGAALEMFTASMADVFKDKGGPNYVEASLRDVRDGTLYFCIVGPKRGKTPHELRQQAEHALATLRTSPRRSRGWASSDCRTDTRQA